MGIKTTLTRYFETGGSLIQIYPQHPSSNEIFETMSCRARRSLGEDGSLSKDGDFLFQNFNFTNMLSKKLVEVNFFDTSKHYLEH